MKKVLFLFNPRSGKGQIRGSLPEILDTGVKAGYDVVVHTTQCQGDAINVVRERAREFDRVICSGGDGTLDEVVTGMMQSDVKVPIGYIPAGSTNDFGSSLGIDKNMVDAAQIAFGDNSFKVDVGAFNDDSFIYVAAFGIFTEVSYSTSQDMKNVLGHAAYILEGAKQLMNIPSFRMKVENKGNVEYDEFIYGMVTNSNSVGGFKNLLPGNVELNDGKFEVTLIKSPKNPMELSDILASLRNGNRPTNMVYSFKTDKIKFTCNEEVPWTLDGEFGGKVKTAVIENRNKALEIMVKGLESEK